MRHMKDRAFKCLRQDNNNNFIINLLIKINNIFHKNKK